MHGSGCDDDEPNGSKSVTLVLRLSTLTLALTSSVFMATASECTIVDSLDDAMITVTFKNFPPFVYLVWFNIVATVLEAAGIYLQFVKGDGGDEEEAPKIPRFLLVVFDVAVLALLNLATGAVFSGVVAYGPQINACSATAGRFCHQVNMSKLFSLAASIAAASAAVTKDVKLPFSLWPSSSSDDC